MSVPSFESMSAPTPTPEGAKEEYNALYASWRRAKTRGERLQAIRQWDQIRRSLDTWQALTHLRFNQDTQNEDHKSARAYCDEVRPKLMELDVTMKRELLASPHRSELEQEFGTQAFALWQSDIKTYDPKIAEDLVKEANLQAEFIQLLASAELEFRGVKYNMSGLKQFAEDRDRAVRHDSIRVLWRWFDAQRESLDRIFDDLVRLRHGMARKLGFEDFVPLGYLRMNRVDYGRADVERFRNEVRDRVVPLCEKLRKRQARRLGLSELCYWDESLHDATGNPRPRGDHDWMLARAREMFDQLGRDTGEFFRLLCDRNLLDLKSRQGKAGGGFCTALPAYGVPFIFANFNGTRGDVEVFTHEAGHAFQSWMSRNVKLHDYLWPTTESCEIHSMSLEFLTWPYMEMFFGEQAAGFRDMHLADRLLFLPYGVAVDHFQHLVYQRPEASPEERNRMWQEMERIYLPWRNYGDLERAARGGFWQQQRHIYLMPFYYIDYTLALTCALQFWVRAEEEREVALADYVRLCSRGGEAPFQELARSAGLVSPFEEECLAAVVRQAGERLGVSS